MDETTRNALRRPLRIAMVVFGLLLIGYFGYSWIAGYDQQFFRSGIVIPLTRKVHLAPPQALAHFGTYFLPEYLPKVVALVSQLLFLSLFLIIQFAALFWFMSRGRTYVIYPGEYDVTFDDVRGQPAIVDATKEVVKLFQGFKEFRRRGGYPPHGILFEGPPGTGKTLLGKAIAGETNVPFIYASGTSFSNMFIGVGNLRIWSLFRKARKQSDTYGGAVIFIDELDAVGGSRGQVSGNRDANSFVPPEHREFWARAAATARYIIPGGFAMNSMLVNELLVQMDGLVLPSRRFRHLRRMFGVKPKVPTYNILIIGATNQAATLDPALLRPGRFDRKVHVGLPAAEGRKDILKYYLDKVPHEEMDMEKLANATLHYSPARIKNVINEALIIALQDGREKLTYDDFYQAKLIDEIGLKEPATYTPWEKEMTAIHESGHAVATWFLQPGEAVQVITIQKRGSALGMVHPMDVEERFSKTRHEYLAEIKMFLAGMVAENIWYGRDQTSSGAASDLRNATMIAAHLVAYSGLGSSLISAAAIPPSPYGDEAMKMLLEPGPLRDEIEKVLEECRQDIEALLRKKAHTVEVLRDYLMVEEQVTGDRFEQIMEALGEPRGGDEAAVRRPPKVLAPHRPKPTMETAGGNGQGEGVTVSDVAQPGPEAGDGGDGQGSAPPNPPPAPEPGSAGPLD
jgi:cell division protease FtsH